MSKLPVLPARIVARKLLRAGFLLVYHRGSHAKFRHPETNRTTTVPIHPGDIGKKTIANILKQSGLSVEEFLRL
jgi:predicted RNA binding protein YcfA (HicA-like mRNA interferase family)